MSTRKALKALTLTGAIYGFAGWVYIVINSEVHINTLGMRLTHFAPWPHEDTFGAICFAVSMICCFAYLLLKDD